MFSLKMLTAAREATTKAKNVASAIQQAQRQVNDDNKDVSKKTDKNEQARAKKKAEAELKNAVAQARLAESQLKRAETQKVVALVQAATSIVGAVIGAAIDKKQKKNDTKQMESGTTATAPTETKPTETTTAPTEVKEEVKKDPVEKEKVENEDPVEKEKVAQETPTTSSTETSSTTATSTTKAVENSAAGQETGADVGADKLRDMGATLRAQNKEKGVDLSKASADDLKSMLKGEGNLVGADGKQLSKKEISMAAAKEMTARALDANADKLGSGKISQTFGGRGGDKTSGKQGGNGGSTSGNADDVKLIQSATNLSNGNVATTGSGDDATVAVKSGGDGDGSLVTQENENGLKTDGKFGQNTAKEKFGTANETTETPPAEQKKEAVKEPEKEPEVVAAEETTETQEKLEVKQEETKTDEKKTTENVESEVDTRTLGEKAGDAGKKTGEVIGKILGGPGAAMDAVGGGIDKFFGLNKMSKEDVDGLKAVLEAIMQALGGKKAGGQLSKLLDSASKMGSILTKGGYTDDEGNFHGNKGFAKGLGKIGAMVQAALGTAIGFALSPLTMATKALEGLSKGIAKASNALGYQMAKATGQLEKYAAMGDRLGGRQQKDGSYKLDQNIMGGSLRGMAANDAKKMIDTATTEGKGNVAFEEFKQKSGNSDLSRKDFDTQVEAAGGIDAFVAQEGLSGANMTAEQQKELKSLLTVAFGNDFKGAALDQKVAQVMGGLDGTDTSGNGPGTSLDNATITDGAMEVGGVKIQTNVTQEQFDKMKENPSSPEAQAFFKAVEAAVSAGKGGGENLSVNLSGNTATVSSVTAPTTGDDKTPKPDASKGSITVTAADGKVGVKAEGTLNDQMVEGEKKQNEATTPLDTQSGGAGVNITEGGATNAKGLIDSVFGADPTKQKFDTDIGKEFASFGLSLAKSIPIFGTIGALIADGAGATQGDASGLGLLGQSVGNLKASWNQMTDHLFSSKVDNVQGSMMGDATDSIGDQVNDAYNKAYEGKSGTMEEKKAAAEEAANAVLGQFGLSGSVSSRTNVNNDGDTTGYSLNMGALKSTVKSQLNVSSSTDASGNATFTLGVKGAAKDSVGSNLGSISIGKDGTVTSSSSTVKDEKGKEISLLSKTSGNINYAIQNAGIEGLTINSPEAYRNEMHDKAVGGVIGAFLAGGADNVKQNGAINQTVANMAASTGDKMEIGSTTVDSSGNATVTLKDGRSMTFDKNGAMTDMKKADGTSVGTSMEAFFGAGTLKDGVTAAGAVGTYQSNQTKIDALKKTIEDTYGSVESLSVTFGDAGNIVSADAQLGGAFKQNGGGKLGLDLDVGGGRVGINADRSSGNVMNAGGGWKGGMKADNLNQVLRNGAMKENLAFTAARMLDPNLSRAVFNQQVANAGGLDAFLAQEGITITTDFTNRNVARDIGRGIATLGVDALFAQESSNGASFSVTFSRGQEDGKPGVKSFEGFMQYGTNGNNDLNMLQVTSVNQEAKKQLEADKKTLTTELDTLNKKEVKTEDDRARIEAIKLELGTINTSLGQIAAVSDPKGLALNTQNDARSSVGLGQGGPTTFGLVGEADRQAVTHKDEIDGLNKQIADLGPGGDPVKIKELTTKRDGLVKEANDAKEAARTSFKAGEIDQIKAATGKTEDQILTDRAVEQKVNRDQLKGFEAEVRKSVVQAFADKGIHINADDVDLSKLTYTAGTATGAKDSHAGLWGVSGDISVKDSSGNTYGMNMNLTSREDGSKKLEVGAVTATDANGQKVTDQVTVGDGKGGTKTVSLGDIKGKLENRIGDEFKAQSDFSHGASAVGQGFKSAFASLVDIFAALLPALQALKKAMEDIAEATAKLTAAQEKLAAAQEYANQMGVTADLFGVGNGNLAATINNMTTEQGTESATQLAAAEVADDPDATHLDNDTSSEEAEALDTLVNDPAANAQLAKIAELMGMNPGQLLVWAQQSDMLVELAEMTHDIANLSPYSATVQTMLMIKEMTSKMEERMNIDISPVNN